MSGSRPSQRGRRREGRRRGDGLRSCLGCARASEPSLLLRLARVEGSRVVVDIAHRAGGRGAYFCFNLACIELAFRKRKVGKALRTVGAIGSPAELLEQACRALLDCCSGRLRRAYRMGLVVSDAQTLELAVKTGKVSFLLCASEDVRRLERRAEGEGPLSVPVYEYSCLEELYSVCLVSRLGVLNGRLALELERDLQNLIRLSSPLTGRHCQVQDVPSPRVNARPNDRGVTRSRE